MYIYMYIYIYIVNGGKTQLVSSFHHRNNSGIIDAKMDRFSSTKNSWCDFISPQNWTHVLTLPYYKTAPEKLFIYSMKLISV